MQAELGRLRVIASDAPQPVEPDASIDEGVPTPGGYIREQRLRRGFSLEQLAAATKIPASSLRLLEDDDFGALPGPVFVKGFLRCCTRALGLPSETVMELLYERERAALHARRQQQRPLLGSGLGSGESDVVPARRPKLPPRVKVKERPAPDGGVVRHALMGLPRANALLWLVVLAFIAVLVMAAFNLVGDNPLGPTS
jgi:Helix-turn-helix domain